MSEPGVMQGHYHGGLLLACQPPSRGSGNAMAQAAADAVIGAGAAKP